jgi:hypothetical protein
MTEIVFDENKLTKQSKIETNKQQQNKQKNIQTTKNIYIYISNTLLLCTSFLKQEPPSVYILMNSQELCSHIANLG